MPKSLEERVAKIEHWFSALRIVAVILGITWAWLFIQIRDAKNNIAIISEDIKTINTTIVQWKEDVEIAKNNAIHDIASAEDYALRSINSGAKTAVGIAVKENLNITDNYATLGEYYICKLNQVQDAKPSSDEFIYKRWFRFNYPVAYSEQPTVYISFEPDSKGFAFATYKTEHKTKDGKYIGVTIFAKETQARENNDLVDIKVKCSILTIGK